MDIPVKDLSIKLVADGADPIPEGKTPIFMIAVEFEIKDGRVVALHAANDYTLKVVDYPSGKDFCLYPMSAPVQGSGRG